MRPLLLALVLAAAPFSARAQLGPPAVTVGWFGETLLHPGGRVGAETALAERGGHRLLGGGHLSGYLHAGHHLGLLADLELGYRHTFSGGFFLEARAGLGYLRTFLHGDVFERGSDGTFRRASSLAGANAFALTQAAGVGWDLGRRSGLPLSVFLRLGAFERAPFNQGWAVHLTSQLGLSWQLGASR